MTIDMHVASTAGIRRFVLVSGILALASFVVLFEAFPHLDLITASAVKAACGGEPRYGGWCHGNGIMWYPRALAMALPVIIMAAAAVWAVRAWGCQAQRYRALFLIACFVAGPGLLSNLILKDNWGRARPREVVELGGQKAFTPPLVPSSACDKNCSFVSGEASAVFAALFAAALAFPRRWRTLALLGLAGGLLTGLVRLSMGGHFLSDVLFAGALMALVTVGLHAAFFGLAWTRSSHSTSGPQGEPSLTRIPALEA